jgi:AcrR family transcriptional regulator
MARGEIDAEATDVVAIYDAGVERLAFAVKAASEGEREWESRLAAGLRAGLDFLAANPALARLLLVDSLAPGGPVRLEHERTLERLADALRPPPEFAVAAPEETARLLAGGLASYLSGRLLSDGAARLPESYDVLLGYLLAPVVVRATPRSTDERRVAHN